MGLRGLRNSSDSASRDRDDSADSGQEKPKPKVLHLDSKTNDETTLGVLDSGTAGCSRIEVTVLDPNSTASSQDSDGCCTRGWWATIFSCDSCRKMLNPWQQTPEPLHQCIGWTTWLFLGSAVLYPYIDHHYHGWMNAHLVETISGTLATHPVWSKTMGTIGAAFGCLAFSNLWKKSWKEAKTPENWTEKGTSSCVAKSLTFFTNLGWSFGSVAQLGLLWYPIGGEQSTMHKFFMIPFFLPTAAGMILYAWLTKKKHGWRHWRVWLFTVLALLTVAFAVSSGTIKGHKTQIKMTQDDCVSQSPNSPFICLDERSILEDDSVHGNCRPMIPNYDVPLKKKYKCDVNLTGSFDNAKVNCEAATYEGAPCKLTQAKMTGWFKNIGECKSPDEHLQGPRDTCRDASARNPDGVINDDSFKASCVSTIDTAGNACDYVPASESEKWWTRWSIFEMVGWSSAFTVFGFILVGK